MANFVPTCTRPEIYSFVTLLLLRRVRHNHKYLKHLTNVASITVPAKNTNKNINSSRVYHFLFLLDQKSSFAQGGGG